jgi:peptide-methionine (S)-S-oxide reductase
MVTDHVIRTPEGGTTEPIARTAGYSYITMPVKIILPTGIVLLAAALFVLRDAGRARADAERDTTQLKDGMEVATFGAGCFWCVEAVFENVDGVESVVSGYSGGIRPDPTYEQVSTGVTGYAEACQITFDPKKVAYTELLEIFWKTHDPTTVDRQGNDVGSQYRSVIFYHNEEQKRLAELYRKKLEDAHVYDAPIVTQIVKYQAFHPAEKYHQNYYTENPDQPYCRFVIQPKIEKFRKVFGDKLKKQ